MKLSVFTVVLGELPLAEACAFLKKQGVDAVEIGCGGYPGKNHCNPKNLLGNEHAKKEFLAAIKDNGLELAALSVHGNPVHPVKEIAIGFQKDYEDAIRLAGEMEVERVVCFSGCPGGSPVDKTPNWVTCAWPEDYLRVLEYQWEEVLIPHWQKAAAFAQEHGVKCLAFEMHPGFCVYNPDTLLKLRAAVGDIIGANVDPSHLFWQGINPVMAIRELRDAIYFFHAKDTAIDPANTAVNGVLDTRHYSDSNRSWVFRTVGYGHDQITWNRIISELRAVGYNDVISIEHEDALMSGKEGLSKAIRILKDVLIYEDAGEMYWA